MCHIMSCVCLVIIVFIRIRPSQADPAWDDESMRAKKTHRMNIAELDNCKFEMSFSDLMKCIQTYHLTRLTLYVAHYNLNKMMGFVNFFPLWMPLFFLSLLNFWHHSFSSKPLSSFLNRIHDCLFVPLFHSARILLYLLLFISVCSHSRSRDALPEFWAITTKVNKRQWLFHNNFKTIATHKYICTSIALSKHNKRNVIHFRGFQCIFKDCFCKERHW